MRLGTRKCKKLFLHCETLEDRAVPAAIMNPTFMLYNPIASILKPYATQAANGTTPATMRQAYGINLAAFGTVTGDGTGQTIAIIDAYNEPTITSDLAAFDTNFGLPAPPSFKVENQTGGTSLPAADSRGGWGVETALDVEWAHVIAPKANILLVEAKSAYDSDLYAAVDIARSTPGVSVVSMSWGGNETFNDTGYDSHFTTPSGHNSVTFVASSGDGGAYPGVSYPAVSPNVLGVGGTTLSIANGGYGSESGWAGSGGGISRYYGQPSYQKGVVAQSSSARTVPDVAMDADPNSGVPVFDSYDDGGSTPWLQVGGTSLAAPMWAGVIAVADQGRVLTGAGTLDGRNDTLPKLYALPSSNFHDITTGSNGYAAKTGYDLVTGLGTPIVNQLVSSLAGLPAPTPPPILPPTIGTFTVNPTSVRAGTSVTLTATNVTETGGTITSLKFYRESNNATGLQTGDTLLGSGTQNGTTYTLTTSTTGLVAGTYTYYAVATDAKGVNSAVYSTTLTVTAIPTIGTFTVNPTSVMTGGYVILAAVNVTEPGGTITSLKFYRESNGISGLQTGSDTLAGSGVQNGNNTWILTVGTAGLAAGTYTYYAVATDAKGVNSGVATTTLLVTAAPKLNPTTTTSLSCSVTYAYGYIELVTLTVKVDGAAGQIAPTGYVNFGMNGSYQGCGQLMANKDHPGEATATMYFVFYDHQYINFAATYFGDSTYNGIICTIYVHI